MAEGKDKTKMAFRFNSSKIKIAIILTTLMLPLGYIGIGYMVASASLSVNPGCGMWSNNTPDNWTTDDDWESFEPWNDSAERIDIRKNLDVSNYQIDSYENVSFSPRGDGEITLRGKVLPVGGIKEKILAAKRARIKEIVLCEDNRRDIKEIKEEYLKGLTFHYVTDMSQVLDVALTKQKVKNAKKL